MIGLPHQVIPSTVEEIIPENALPEHVARELAVQKARQVALANPGRLTIGADTIVVYDNNILGKPANAPEAVSMLRSLSGRTHVVITAVALVRYTDSSMEPSASAHHKISDTTPDHSTAQITETVFHETTSVTFAALSDHEINAYVSTGSPMDKAGSYGIQDDLGSLFVSRIVGDYYNVVGLPVHMLYQQLKAFAPEYAAGIFASNPSINPVT